MNRFIYFLQNFIWIILYSNLLAQSPSKNALQIVPEYKGGFRFGANMGYYAPYTDEQLADIAAGNPALKVAGAGITSLRPAMFGYFAEEWGYDIRIQAFKHYEKLGMSENVCFIGYPPAQYRDKTVYCGKDTSALYANMYEPIWDKGENGTPVNDKNYYALYVYKTVKNYGQQVRFWEIWNEPDYAFNYNNMLPPDKKGSWWSQDPAPCDYSIHAPIQHYIRMLRISYEVIKSLYPKSYVAVGGIGFPSFLDGILRQTDNPDAGKTTSAYPNRGGAYFDVLSYHTYPHIDNSVREWSNAKQGFVHFRHSDRAAAGVIRLKKEFEVVLKKHGFEGKKYPKKRFIITESNIPCKEFGEFMGTPQAQANFLVKAAIQCMKNEVDQLYVYSLGELKEDKEARNEFDKMGLYEKLEGKTPYSSKLTPAGIAYKTASILLTGSVFDSVQTRKLNLPNQVDGGAFKCKDGTYLYCLWAKTNIDRSETAKWEYSFPLSLKINRLDIKEWNYTATQKSVHSKPTKIQLSSSPCFLKPIP
ncbi:MAG: hypothetical protein RL329_314 [Bacteroidota bacterium]|jgi:hypothetical protein